MKKAFFLQKEEKLFDRGGFRVQGKKEIDLPRFVLTEGGVVDRTNEFFLHVLIEAETKIVILLEWGLVGVSDYFFNRLDDCADEALEGVDWQVIDVEPFTGYLKGTLEDLSGALRDDVLKGQSLADLVKIVGPFMGKTKGEFIPNPCKSFIFFKSEGTSPSGTEGLFGIVIAQAHIVAFNLAIEVHD